MRDKNVFLDLTPTFYDGFFLKITEPSIVMSSDAQAAEVASAAHAASSGTTPWSSGYGNQVSNLPLDPTCAGSTLEKPAAKQAFATFVNLHQARVSQPSTQFAP